MTIKNGTGLKNAVSSVIVGTVRLDNWGAMTIFGGDFAIELY
jgi:hypothetical protein